MNLPEKIEQNPTGIIHTTISGQLKIRHLKNPVPIEQTLVVCFQLMGLKPDNFPSKDPKYNEWQFLVNHIKKNYGGLVAKELKLAFELAAQHKLGLSKEETNCYQNFSPEYVGRILDAYKAFKAKELARPGAKALNAPETRLEQWDQIKYFDKHLFKPYEKLLNNDPFPWTETKCTELYRQLKVIGLNLVDEDIKQEYLDKYNNLKVHRSQLKKETARLTRELKAAYFKNYISNLAFESLDIKIIVGDKLKK